MKGIVKLVNPKSGMIAVEVDGGDLTVFEILGTTDNFDLEDEIVGPLNLCGSVTLINMTKSKTFNTFIEDIHCDRTRAIYLLR